jgi:hypothetical protein
MTDLAIQRVLSHRARPINNSPAKVTSVRTGATVRILMAADSNPGAWYLNGWMIHAGNIKNATVSAVRTTMDVQRTQVRREVMQISGYIENNTPGHEMYFPATFLPSVPYQSLGDPRMLPGR